MSVLLAVAAALAATLPLPGDCIADGPVEAARGSGSLVLSVHTHEGRPVLRATGRIEAGATDRLVLALQAEAIDEVWFDSAGGDREEGARLGSALRRAGMITRIPDGASCSGACVDAFLGGIGRTVDPGGQIGIMAMPLSDEAATLSQAEREQAAGRWAERQADYYIRAGVSRGLLRLQLETPAGTICWLTRAAQQRYNVTNAPLFRPARNAPAPPPRR